MILWQRLTMTAHHKTKTKKIQLMKLIRTNCQTFSLVWFGFSHQTNYWENAKKNVSPLSLGDDVACMCALSRSLFLYLVACLLVCLFVRLEIVIHNMPLLFAWTRDDDKNGHITRHIWFNLKRIRYEMAVTFSYWVSFFLCWRWQILLCVWVCVACVCMFVSCMMQ